MSNITIYTATGSLELLRDRASQFSSIQRRYELVEGVKVKMGDEMQNPSLLVIDFVMAGVDINGAWAARDAAEDAWTNAVNINMGGVTWPVQPVSFKSDPVHFRFNIRASFYVQNIYPLVNPDPNFYPYYALLNADGSLFINADGSIGTEAGS